MSKGILWSFGDSFTAGNVKSFNSGVPYPYCNTIGKPRSYPTLIAERLGLKSINLAYGGASNRDILFQVANAYQNFDSTKDTIIIGLSTPFRGNIERSNKEVLKELIQILSSLNSLLINHKYTVTSAFCPLVPTYFNSSDLDFSFYNYVEWGKPNNTLIDICKGTWLSHDKESQGDRKFLSDNVSLAELSTLNTLEDCGHPSNHGHRLIADTLIPYLGKFVI